MKNTRLAHTTAPLIPARALVIAALALTSCADAGPPQEERDQDPQSAIPSCGENLDTPLFNTLPVDQAAIDEVIVFGELDPGGGDVIPNHQGGIRLAGQGVALVAPGDGFLVGVRSSTFLASPFREGETDYGLFLRPCKEATATLLHVTALTPALEALLADARCETYETESETIDDCKVEGLEIVVAAGESLGTVGGATAGGFDFDMTDTRSVAAVTARAGDDYKHAVCFSRYFTAEHRALLDARTGLLGEARVGDPACGTIEVDIAGTAQGVWVAKENPVPYQGGAEAYVTLAPDFLDPEGALDFSFGTAGQPRLLSYTRSFVGRTNRDFEGVTGDDLITCYGSPDGTVSVLLSLSSTQELTLEVLLHDPGTTPCAGAPESWTFSDEAVTYIR